jgi:hypothetical protein
MRPLGRPRCRWEDNIRMELEKIGWEGVGVIISFSRTLLHGVSLTCKASV